MKLNAVSQSVSHYSVENIYIFLLAYSTKEFQASQLIVLAVFGVMD